MALAYANSKKKDNSVLYGVLALLLWFLYMFRNQLMAMFSNTSANSNIKREVQIKQEPQVNNLGMDVPKLTNVTNPIEWLRSNNPFKEISRQVKEVKDSSWLNTSGGFSVKGVSLSDYNTPKIGYNPIKSAWIKDVKNPFGIVMKPTFY